MFVTPNRLTLGRPDEIIDPYHFVEFDPDELARALRRPLRARSRSSGSSARARYMEIFDEERAKLDRLLGRTRCGCGGWSRSAPSSRLYDAMLRRVTAGRRPAAAAIERRDFELRDDGLGAALDVCAICRRPVDAERTADPRALRAGAARRSTDAGDAASRPDPLPALRRRDHRPAARRRGARRRLRRLVPAPTPGAASTSPATRSSAAPAALLAAPDRRDRAAGAGARRRRRRRHADRRAAPRGREATGLERNAARPDFRDEPIEEVEGEGLGRGRLLALARAPAASRGDAIRAGRPPARARRRRRRRRAQHRQPPGAGCSATDWLHLDMPRHLVHLSTGDPAPRASTSDGFTVERDLAPARRADRDRLARRASSARCPATSTSTRRCAARRRAVAPIGPGRRAASIARRQSSCSRLAAACCGRRDRA